VVVFLKVCCCGCCHIAYADAIVVAAIVAIAIAASCQLIVAFSLWIFDLLLRSLHPCQCCSHCLIFLLSLLHADVVLPPPLQLLLAVVVAIVIAAG